MDRPRFSLAAMLTSVLTVGALLPLVLHSWAEFKSWDKPWLMMTPILLLLGGATMLMGALVEKYVRAKRAKHERDA